MKALFRFIDKGRSKNPGLLYSSNGCNIHIDGNIKVLLVAGVRKMPFPSPRPSFRRPLRSLKHSYHTSFPHSSPVVYILPLSLSPHSTHPALPPRPVPHALYEIVKRLLGWGGGGRERGELESASFPTQPATHLPKLIKQLDTWLKIDMRGKLTNQLPFTSR